MKRDALTSALMWVVDVDKNKSKWDRRRHSGLGDGELIDIIAKESRQGSHFFGEDYIAIEYTLAGPVISWNGRPLPYDAIVRAIRSELDIPRSEDVQQIALF